MKRGECSMPGGGEVIAYLRDIQRKTAAVPPVEKRRIVGR